MTVSRSSSSTSRTPSAASWSRPRGPAPPNSWKSCAPVLLALDTSTDWASVALFDGRDQFYAAFYQERNRKWMRRSPFLAATLDEICRQIGTHTLFVGEIDTEIEAALRDLLGPKALFASPASRVRRAGYLAELGWRELETRTQVKISEIEPLYVRQPSIRGSFEQPFASPPSDERALGLPKRS